MRLRALVLSLIPGVAHIDLGRAGRGIAVFAAFALSVNVALLGPVFSPDPRLRAAGAGTAAALWLLGALDALRLARRPTPPAPEVKTP
jgi:hypothetical protein